MKDCIHHSPPISFEEGDVCPECGKKDALVFISRDVFEEVAK